MKKLFLSFIIAFLLSSCAKNINKSGYSIDKKDLEQIKVGVSNKESVLNTMDHPTNTHPNNPNKWVYHSYKTKKLMFFKPKIVEQDVVIISFNNEEIVESIAKYDQNNYININPNSGKTSISTKEEKGLVRDIIDNIGSITPAI